MNKNQIVIHASGKQTRIALIENGELAQFFIESPENRRSVGDIYVAEVHKVMGGIRAAFIDMGTPKDAFLHFSDLGEHLDDYLVMLNGRDSLNKDAVKAVEEFRKKLAANGDNDGTRRSTAQEQNLLGALLQPKQKMLVQIVKEPIGNKGPRVSTDITLPGRLLVLIPMGNYVAVSKRIRSFRERRRLRSTLSSMLPEGFGVIVRTVADGQDEKALRDDLQDLLDKWKNVMDNLRDAKPTTLLHRDLDMTESLVRDLFSKNYDRILIDDPAMGKQLKHYVSRIAPDMVKNIELFRGKEHIFEHMKISRDVESIFSPRVKMPSGGYLIFEQTEAMYVVDVNSGRYAAKKAQEDNSLRTNLEAAREIAKQLRLRDIGGIIVVDFIDLQDDGNRKKVYDELKKEFRKDRAKTNLLPMSDFGLVQITRQRIRPSVVKSVSLVCGMCGGSGSIVSQNTVLSDIETWLSKYANNYKKRSVELYVNPYFHSLLTRGILSQRLRWVFKYRVNIAILPDESVSLNEYKVLLMGTEVEITQTVQESLSIEDAVKDAEKRLAELESEGQRDDSLLDYGADEKSEGKAAPAKDKPARRAPAPSRQQQREKPEPKKPAASPASASRSDDSGRRSSRDGDDDGQKTQRQDTRRSNVKSKYYKNREEEEEAMDAESGRSSRSGSGSKTAPETTESVDSSPKTDSKGEPLRNAEDVAREYREKRLREEAEQKSMAEQQSASDSEQPAEKDVKEEKKTAPSKSAATTDKKARAESDEQNTGEPNGTEEDKSGTEAEKPKTRRGRPKKAEQEGGEIVKKKPAAKKPATGKSSKSDKTLVKKPKSQAKAEVEAQPDSASDVNPDSKAD
ncbi:MAG: Rne/Rng family ribonuclease [Balneolaceae bacterium]|nr:MAG: Rne/Rng family ribonuclease [Balneolaceae bacterium]